MAGSNTSSVVYSGELGPDGINDDFPDGCGKFRIAVSKSSSAAATGVEGNGRNWGGSGGGGGAAAAAVEDGGGDIVDGRRETSCSGCCCLLPGCLAVVDGCGCGCSKSPNVCWNNVVVGRVFLGLGLATFATGMLGTFSSSSAPGLLDGCSSSSSTAFGSHGFPCTYENSRLLPSGST